MDERDLKACTVRLKVGSESGTGFFVGDSTVLTCEHVVRNAGLQGEVSVGADDLGKVIRLDRDLDVALLRVTASSGRLALLDGEFKLDDPTYSYGYPESAGDPVSGKVIDLDGLGLIKFKDTFVEPGMSGAPLLNLRTGKVCGMVKASLDPGGGYAVRGEILQKFLMEPATHADFLHGVPSPWRARVEGFLTQYLGTSTCPAPFGGRDNNLQELDRWLTTPESPRYALIAARGGVGKSALLAHWVDALQKRGAPFLLVYHPISARRETNSASAVFQCLAFRLAAVFADPAPDSQDVDQLREVILGYIERANRENRPLLIALDGLDEAAGWQTDTRLFPPTRQGCVRIVASARPLPGEGPKEWLVRLGWNPSGVAKRLDLDLLDKEGVADVLRHMGNPLAPLAGRFDVVGTLYRKSEGDPLLVGLYVEKLRECVTCPQSFQASELERIEPGLAGFFAYWLQDQAKLWGGDRHNREPRVRTMLGLCSCAYGPLTREDFRALASETFARNADVEITAMDLSRFLTIEAGAHTYVFGHSRFGDFVREELLEPEERADLTTRFVAYGSRMLAELNDEQREHAPTYVVRWYATHLADLRRPLEAFRPLLSFRWYQECERLDGTPAGFLGDLDQAWNAASGQAGVGTRVRIALLRSSLLTLARSIPIEVFGRCARASILSPILAEVIVRQHDDAGTRSQYFLVLAAVVPDRGNRFLGEALEAARQIQDEDSRAQALSAVAARLDTAVLHQLAEDFQSLIQQNEAVRFLNLIASRWPIYVKASKKASADELAYWLEPLSREPRYHLLRAISALLPAIEHTGGEQAVIETAEAIIDTARWWR